MWRNWCRRKQWVLRQSDRTEVVSLDIPVSLISGAEGRWRVYALQVRASWLGLALLSWFSSWTHREWAVHSTPLDFVSFLWFLSPGLTLRIKWHSVMVYVWTPPKAPCIHGWGFEGGDVTGGVWTPGCGLLGDLFLPCSSFCTLLPATWSAFFWQILPPCLPEPKSSSPLLGCVS